MAVGLLYSVTVYYFLPAMENQVLGSNMKILRQLRDDFDYRYNKIDESMLFIYGLNSQSKSDLQNKSELLGMLEEIKDGKKVNEYDLQKAWGDLHAYISWALDDLDSIFLIPQKGDNLTYAKYQTVDLSYDFPQKQWFKRIQQEGGRKIEMLGGETPLDYYTGGKSGVITFARNIYLPDNPYEKKPLATMLININNLMFANMIDVYNSGYIKDFIVMDANGYLYFCKDSSLFGKKLPEYERIVSKLSEESGYFGYSSSDGVNFCCYYQSKVTGTYFMAIIPKEQLYKDANVIKNFIILIILFFLFIGLGLSYFSSRSRYKPIKLLLQSMKRVEKGDLEVKLGYRVKDETGVIINGFNDMVVKLKNHINEVYVSEIKKKEAMFCALKSQVDAHFLCNVIEVVRLRAMENGDLETAEVVKLLGRFYRERLGVNEDLIDIKNELEITKTYARIEEYRKNCTIRFKTDIPENYMNCMIPKFTFQPVVENSIKHGCGGMKEIEIFITAYSVDNTIAIEISDNGTGIEEERQKEILREIESKPDFTSNEHIGLRNINTRLKLYFGDNYGIKLRSSCNGTTISILIPADRGEAIV